MAENTVKDFTEKETKTYIRNHYSKDSIKFITTMIHYWNGKHPTQVFFRQELKEIRRERIYNMNHLLNWSSRRFK